jgi:sugar/nucleoside kinase (ribokinase family)
MRYDVLLVGDYWYDLIFTDLPRLPELGRELYAGGFDNVPGGPFINAVALHRLGLRVGWAADFGDDVFSRLVLEAVRREGLDEALFQHHARPYRRLTAAASFPGDRAFLSYTDPGPKLSAPLKALAAARVSARVVLVPGLIYGPLFDSTHLLVRARGMKIVMDCHLTDRTLADPALRRALGHVDVFMPNANEARCLTGQATTLEALHALSEHCPLVVVKDGAQGAYGLRRGEVMVHAPALAVRVVDTTGAGDCFGAGFVRAWLDERPLEECLRWGNICGGLSTTARGGATAAPRLDEVEAYLHGRSP